MMATVIARDVQRPCAVQWTGRRGLKVLSTTYCGLEVAAGDGVTQLPDQTQLCPFCQAAIQVNTNANSMAPTDEGPASDALMTRVLDLEARLLALEARIGSH